MKREAKSAAKFGQYSLVWLTLISCQAALGADVDISKLPPPADVQVDFARDIKPILEANCLRCHGPDKPKSGFRLDNLQAALKGGEEGVDILPGHSAQSPLIHYVAYLVPDMEMPPIGRGNQLTPEQVSLLRAWIDQGAAWNATILTNNLEFTFSPILGGTTATGNQQQFRALNWQDVGPYNGVEEFEALKQIGPDTKLYLAGHEVPNDYKISLSLDQNNLGFIHSGWEQYRKYFNDTGGYYPALVQPAPSLGENLYLDIGRAWFDLGVTLPDWPRLVFGYEYDYRQGNEATTEWGAVGTNPATARNIAPASLNINEGVQILKFDLNDEIKGIAVEDQFRGEFYHLNMGGTNTIFSETPQNINQGTTYFQGANTIRLGKKFNDWLTGSAGYLYSSLDADSFFTMAEPTLLQQVSVPQITLERDSNVGNLNGFLGPFDGLTISSGVQVEFSRQTGFGTGTLDQQTPPPPFTDLLIPFNEASDYDEKSIQEDLSLHYTKIPFTSLFAEGRFEQQSIGQSDQFDSSQNILNKAVFSQHTDFSSLLTDVRVGFNTSPWRSIDFSASYRYYDNDSQYDSDPLVQPVQTGYPTFINSRELTTDEVQAKLAWRLNSNFKTSLSYQYLATDYGLDTKAYLSFGNVISPGGQLLAGRDRSDIYSVNATWKPMPRLYLSTTFSYQTSSTTTDANGSPAVVPYQGNIYTVLANGTYIFNQTTDLFGSYAFSKADYAQNNFATGLPLGINYLRQSVQIGLVRHFTQNISAKLQYRLDYYNEPSSGGANNYCANSIFGVFTFKFQ